MQLTGNSNTEYSTRIDFFKDQQFKSFRRTIKCDGASKIGEFVVNFIFNVEFGV